MSCPRSLGLATLAVVLALAGGCSKPKFEVEKFAALEPKGEMFIPMYPPEKAIPVTVSATTGGVPIELYVIAAVNQEEAERIIRKQDTKSFIASRINKVDPRCEGTLPAGNGYVIVLVNSSSDKSASVTVRISEREP